MLYLSPNPPADVSFISIAKNHFYAEQLYKVERKMKVKITMYQVPLYDTISGKCWGRRDPGLVSN